MIATETFDLEQFYAEATATLTAITPHLPVLRRFADGCTHAVEFGTGRGVSAAALLLEVPTVVSYDLVDTPEARGLKALVGDRWDYRIADSRTAVVPTTDLILFDALHTFAQVEAELRQAEQARRYLIFHDVTTFGEVAADGETGTQVWAHHQGTSVPREHWGIRPAIDQFQIAHPWWQIAYRVVASHGLLVLERRGHGPSQ